MIDSLEQIQARSRLLLEEVRQEAQPFVELLEAWVASDDEDLKAELEAMPEDEAVDLKPIPDQARWCVFTHIAHTERWILWNKVVE